MLQNSLAYATRVRTIKNDVTKNEANKEMLRLKKQVRPGLWRRQCIGQAHSVRSQSVLGARSEAQ